MIAEVIDVTKFTGVIDFTNAKLACKKCPWSAHRPCGVRMRTTDGTTTRLA